MGSCVIRSLLTLVDCGAWSRPASRTWSQVTLPSTGDEFPARSGHSAVAVGRSIVVFGGLNPATGAVFNDVHAFDTRALAAPSLRSYPPSCVPTNACVWCLSDASTWSRAEIADGEVPMPRNAHATVLLPPTSLNAGASHHRMLIFGGSSPRDGVFDDAFVLEIPAGGVTAARLGASEPLRWERIEFAGDDTPEARELHCATLLSQSSSSTSSLVCFSGGRNRDGNVCTDMALLDVCSWQWQLVPICEWNRCSHVAGLVDGALVSFGGFDGGALSDDTWTYRDNTESWERAVIKFDSSSIDSAGDTRKADGSPETRIPLERFGHAGCTIELQSPAAAPSGKDEERSAAALLVFGGMNAWTDLNDVLIVAPYQERS